MKHNFFNYILLILITISGSSCLKHDLPDLPLWDGNIINRVYVEHRFNHPTNERDGQPIVAYQALTVTSTVDEAANTLNIALRVPAANTTGFTATERDKVMQNNLWIYFDISTAASMQPVGNTPKPGDPTDLTKSQQYEVTAADGSKRVWTVNVISFTK